VRFSSYAFPILGAVAILGCENATYDDCRAVEDPSASTGARRDQCPPSVFRPSTTQWRDIFGQVRRGENNVSSAIIQIEPTTEYAGETNGLRTTITSTTGGLFGPVHQVSLRYNISFRDGADILLYRGVGGRFVSPNFEASGVSPARFDRAYVGKLDIILEQPLPQGKALTFLATGEKTYDVVGSLEAGLSILGSDYVYPATIHALMHDAGGDLTTATAYAKTDINVTANANHPVRLRFDEIRDFKETTALVSPLSSPAYVPGNIELNVGYSRTSARRIGIIGLNTLRKFPVFPNHAYITYRAHIDAADGSISDSGERGLDIFQKENLVALPSVPTLVSPADGSAANAELIAAGAQGGIFEHVLLPKSGAGSIRILTNRAATAIPDLRALGAAVLEGDYVWSVRTYPEIKAPEGFGGIDSRRYLPYGASIPRSLRFASPAQ